MGIFNRTEPRDGKASDIEEHIKRFRRTYRRRLRKLAVQSEPLADLIVSFPAAAFALVTLHGTTAQRLEAIRLVKTGQPLKRVAAALGVPFWMRKLPPEALAFEFPAKLPENAQFGARLAGLIPEDPDRQAPWFAAVLQAEAAHSEHFALWVANNANALPPVENADAVRLLALYAWYSDQSGTTGGKLIPLRWNDRMGMARAVDRLKDWIDAIRQDVFLGEIGVENTWLNGGRAAGYRFVPLTNLAELRDEGNAMDNCVADYAWQLARNECRIFSMRRGATHVATIEIRVHHSHPRVPMIEQLYGPDNEDAPVRVWAAAYTWLGKQAKYDMPETSDHDELPPPAAAWQRIWRPYWRDQGVNDLIPEAPDRGTLPLIARKLTALINASR